MKIVKYYTVENRVIKDGKTSNWSVNRDENLNWRFETLSEAKIVLENLYDFHRRKFQDITFEYKIFLHEDHVTEEYHTYKRSV